MPMMVLVGSVDRVHEPLNRASEGIWRCVGVCLRLGKDLLQSVGDPVLTGRTVVNEISLDVREKLRQVATAPIDELALLGWKIAADHVGDLKDGASLEPHCLLCAISPA